MTAPARKRLSIAATTLALTAAGLLTATPANAETTASAEGATGTASTTSTETTAGVESANSPTAAESRSAAETDPRHRQRGQARPQPTARRSAAGTPVLTVSVRDRAGVAPHTDQAGYALAFDLATGALTVVLLTDGVGTAEVAPGSYLVQAFVETVEPDGDISLSVPMRSRVRVTKDTSTTLDGRTTAPVEVAVDRAEARLAGGTVQATMATPGEMIWFAADFDYPGGLYVQPTGPSPA